MTSVDDVQIDGDEQLENRLGDLSVQDQVLYCFDLKQICVSLDARRRR